MTVTTRPQASGRSADRSRKVDAQTTEVGGRAVAIAIVLAAALAAVLIADGLPIVGWVERLTEDLRMSFLRQSTEPRSDIVVVAINEETLDTLPYRSPVDREFLADLLERLAAAGVRGVLIDMLFDRPTEAAKDKHLETVLRSFPVPLVVAWGDPGPMLTETQHAYMQRYLDGVGRGYANLVRDGNDGVVRVAKLRFPEFQEDLLSLPAALASKLGAALPDSPLVIDYRAAPDPNTPAIPSFPAHFVPKLPKQFFTGKLVLIGGDLLETDRIRTPLVAGYGLDAGMLPGMTIHGQVLAQILDGRRIRASGIAGELSLAAVAAALAAILARVNMSLAAKLSLAGVGLIGLSAYVAVSYAMLGIMVPAISPAMAFVISLGANSFHQQRLHLEQRRFIRSAFSHYVPEHVVRLLEKEPWRLRRGGERRNLTYLFTDIQGFTTLSESADPEKLVSALNAYLDSASKIVVEHNGSIDKFIGDAVVAVFGAFTDDPGHPSDAVRSALAIDQFAERFRAEQAANGLPFGITRIGVNTGDAIVGNFGGSARLDYTAIGDTVNTAARFEGVNKYTGTRICVAESTATRCPDIAFRPIGDLVVIGKAEASKAFEPVAPDSPAAALLAEYGAAYKMAETGDPGAAAAFERLAHQAPKDGLIAFHSARLREGPPTSLIRLKEK